MPPKPPPAATRTPVASPAREQRQKLLKLVGAVIILGVLILLPRIGSFGLWDPQEITVADAARNVSRSGDWLAVWDKQPPLTTWLVATGIDVLGPSELAGRLPLALAGLAALLATFTLGLRMRRPRVGLFAAAILLSSPLFVFQSRQLASDIGSLAGGAFAMLGAYGLLWPPEGKRRPLFLGLDLAAVVLGLGFCFLGGGIFRGFMPPVAAVGLAAAVAAYGRFGDAPPAEGARPTSRWQRPAAWFAVGAAVLTLFSVAILIHEVFTLVDAQPGQRALFGKTFTVAKDYLPILAGRWKVIPAANSTFDFLIEQVGFGMFPWSALAPIAVLKLGASAVGNTRDRASWNGVFLISWVVVAYVVDAFWVHKMAEVRYAAIPAIALALGLFVDEMFAAKLENDPTAAPEAREGAPIAALLVVIAAVMMSLDGNWLPEILASVHLDAHLKMPPQFNPGPAILVIGFVFAAAAGLSLHLDPAKPLQHKIVRAGLYTMLGAGVAFGCFLSWIFTPTLSQHLSYKNVFQSYFEHRKDNEALGVLGIPGAGPDFYANGAPLTRLDTVPQMLDFLRKPDRDFAIMPAERVCSVHEYAVGKPTEWHIIDRENSRFALLSNRLADGEKDVSPLLAVFRGAPPEKFGRNVTADFENTIQLLGVDMPEQVGKGDHFKVTLWFKILKRPTQNYQIFVHFDGPGLRFQGDHTPAECGTTSWMPNDIVADTFEVEAGSLTTPRATYQTYIGLFTGSGGVYKNMNVTTPDHDNNNRVPIGSIVVN